jgi:hypothetical protein
MPRWFSEQGEVMGKVWVIDTIKKAAPKTNPIPRTRPAPVEAAAKPKKNGGKKNGGANPWKRVLASYLTGPISVAVWMHGPGRKTWMVTGLACIAIAMLLVTSGASIGASLLDQSYGVLFWLVVVPLAIVALATAWTLAIDRAGRGKTIPASWYPNWIRRPWSIFLCGLMVPGLGLRIAGRPKYAARVFWIVGPLAAALVIILNSRRLWHRSLSGIPAGISGPSLETIFVIATVGGVVMLLAWIVQALDGSRRVSNRRSVAGSNVVSIVLLVTLVLGAVSFRPIEFARDLDVAGTALRAEGFRLIPLKLSEAAARLDPAAPVYVADAAELAKELGMTELAREKREILERRMETYMAILLQAETPSRTIDEPPYASVYGADVEDYLPELDHTVYRNN